MASKIQDMVPTQNIPDDNPNRGGLAPADRQCQYTLASGFHCRRWSIRGHNYCHEHGRWMECRVEGPIEVPLMEDPSAVQLVVTQTVRAMGWGQIPPANGRAILHGCRIVQNGFSQELAEAKYRLKCHQLGVDPERFLPARAIPRMPDSGQDTPIAPSAPRAFRPGATEHPGENRALAPEEDFSQSAQLDLQAAGLNPPGSPSPASTRRFASSHIAADEGDDLQNPAALPLAGCPISPEPGEMGERKSAPLCVRA